MKITIVVQAQNEVDNNLKDEILFHKFNDETVLETVVQECKKVNNSNVVILTSIGNQECKELQYIKNESIPVYIKKDNSFVESFMKICEVEKSDIIIRVNGSNPLISYEQISKGIEAHIKSNSEYSFYDGFPLGIVPSEILKASILFNSDVLELEDRRVKNFITSIRNNESYIKNIIKANREYFNISTLKLNATYRNIKKLEEIFNDDKSPLNIIKYFDPVPQIRNIEITNICNLECVMCPRCGQQSEFSIYKNKLGSMKFENFKTIIDQFPHIGSITINGGEPLLNKDVRKIVEYCIEKNIEMHLTTNATLIDEEMSEFIVKNFAHVQLSMDGAKKKTFEDIRKNSNFEKVINSIKLINNARKSQIIPSLKLLSVNYVCMEQNYKEMPEFVDLMNQLNISNINFLQYTKSFYISNQTLLNNLEIKDINNFNKICDIVEEKCKKGNVNVSIFKNSQLKSLTFDKCEWRNEFWLTWEGYITPCCTLDRPNVINFGNLLKNNICELYNDEKWQEFRWKLFNNDAIDVCKKYCNIYK